jgi:IS5 family transposase
VNPYLDRKGIHTSTDTIVDATIFAAPSSTKKQKKERDSQMHQTEKGCDQRSIRDLWFRPHLSINP